MAAALDAEGIGGAREGRECDKCRLGRPPRGGHAHLSLSVSPPAAARTRAPPPPARPPSAACAANMTSAFKLDFLPDMMVEGRLLVPDRM